MLKNPVQIRELLVERFRGIQRPEAAIQLKQEDISVGITLVYGPNGSGKTTSALAMQGLVWPDTLSDPDSIVKGRFEIGTEQWHTEVLGGRVTCRKDGTAVRPIKLASSGEPARYRLDLTDLLTSSDDALATHIRWELHGGYDLDQAARELNFSDKIPASSIKEVKELKEARKRYRDAFEEQRRLRQREEQLSSLQEQERAAVKAGKEAEVLTLVIGRYQALQEKRAAQEELAHYPEAVSRISEEHPGRLNQIWANLEEYQRKRREACRRFEAAEKRLTASALNDDLVKSVNINELENLREEVAAAENAVTEHERERQGKRRHEEVLREKCGAVEAAGHQLEKLDTLPQTDLFEFARNWADIEARDRACTTLRDMFVNYPEPYQDYLSRLPRGIECLRTWMRHDGTGQITTAGKSMLAALSAVMLGTSALVLCGFFYDPRWFFMVLPFIVVGAYSGYTLMRWKKDRRERAGRARRDYTELNLPDPDAWDCAAVGEQLQELEKEYDEQRLYAMVDQIRSGTIAPQQEQLEREKRAAAQRRQQIRERVGAVPNFDDASFAAFMQAVANWQQVRGDVAEYEQKLQQAMKQKDECLCRFNTVLAKYGAERAANSSEVKSRVQESRERVEYYKKARNDLDAARTEIDRCDERIKEEQRLRGEILQYLDLEDSGEPAQLYNYLERLKQWLDQKNDYEQIQDRLRAAEAKRKEYETALKACTEMREEWYQAPVQELEDQMQTRQSEAEKRQALHDEITRIETQVASARQKHDVEETLTAVREAEARLTARRESTCNAVLGAGLIDYTQRCTRRQTSRVLPRAEELFTALTEGMYELHIGGSEGKAVFLARNTLTGNYHGLNSLSSGERAQLLLAVRLGYIEQQEEEAENVAPPLIFDEVLANSDDQAAGAIIQSVIQLASRGRQIFYFTAQKDEVAKWRDMLISTGTPFSLITLPQAVREELKGPSSFAGPDLVSVPEPGQEGYRQYGQTVNVPRVDPWQDAASLHLWYLLDSSEDLYRLLQNNCAYWGQLRQILRGRDPASLLNAVGCRRPEEISRRALARATVWQTLFEHWRVGRGRPVTREVLQRVAAVTNKFFDKVDELAQDVDRDGEQLIRALKQGGVSNFRKNKVEQLADELYEEGCLDAREKCSVDDLQGEALKAAAAYIEQDILRISEIKAMVGLLQCSMG